MSNEYKSVVMGVEKMNAKLTKFVSEFPAYKTTVMTKLGNQSRKKIVDKGNSMFKHPKPNHRKSLTKNVSFTRKKPFEEGDITEVDVKAKSPHFHLVNNGHILTDSLGVKMGYVQPYHYKEKAMHGFDKQSQAEVDKTLKTVMKKAGLI